MVSINNTLFLKLIILQIFFSLISSETIENLSEYKYPSAEISDNIINVAIMGTNDINGEIFPNIFQYQGNTTLESGGATNIYSYVEALREEYDKYFLWFDGGDQFQGTMECMLSEGGIMKDFYNSAKLDGIAIGNHEFDYGIEKLKKHIESENFIT